ncbi:MAG: hypothetical protein AVDCRST_MAG68-3575, partial [uncultured Gemmatimonadetes bacterium]
EQRHPRDLRPHVGPGRHHAQPHPAPAGAARADGGGGVHGAPASAVHREPAPEAAGGRRVGVVAARGDEPALPDGGGPAGPLRARALADRARAGGHASRRRPGRAAPAQRAGAAHHAVAGLLLVLRRPVGPPACRSLRGAHGPGGAPGPGGRRVDGGRPGVRHRAAGRGARPLRGAGGGGGCVRRDAGGRPRAPGHGGQRGGARRRAGSAPLGGRRAGRGGGVAGAALPGRPRGGAGRSLSRAAPRRPAGGGGHDAPRPRRVPPHHGPRVAGLRPRADGALAVRRRLRAAALRSAPARPGGQGPHALRRLRPEAGV